MRDYLGSAAEELTRLQKMARQVFSAAGYREIRTPVLEAGRLFDRSLGEESDVVSKEMYTVEQSGDRVIALRPENTAGIVRALIEHGLISNRNQLKVHYNGPMFRHERPQSGRLRQFHQAGLEVFGRPEPLADAEVISLAQSFLTAAGIDNHTLCLNSIGCPECRPAFVKALRESIEPYKEKICSDCRHRLETNPLRILDCKEPECRGIYSEEAPQISDFWCDECKPHFARVKELLSAYEVKFQEDPRLVRGLDYYTRTTFEFISEQLGGQDAILAGGRYDELVEQLGGNSTPAIGFSAGLERMMLLRSTYHEEQVDVKVDCYFIPMNREALEKLLPVIKNCRGREELSLSCEIGNPEDSIKAQLRRANRYEARLALICGPRELENQQITVKEMASGEQENIEFKSDEGLINQLTQYL